MPIILPPDPTAYASPVTLARIEREVLRRTGPYARYAASDGVHTVTSVFVDALTSTLNVGGHRGMYLLRRGVTDDGSEDGAQIVGFDAGDRQRRITNWEQPLGRLDVDAPWATPPVEGEWLEICHLDPDQIVRPACQNGLRRVKVEDRQSVALTGVSAERNLTAALPYITAKNQVKGVFYAPVGSSYDPDPVGWYDLFESAGAVYLAIAPDPYPNTLYVAANRPAHCVVNGLVDMRGPRTDTDELLVDLDRAAAAGHIECFRSPRAAAALKAMADRGITLTQQQAADEHTRQNRRRVTRPKVRWQLSRPLWGPVPV